MRIFGNSMVILFLKFCSQNAELLKIKEEKEKELREDIYKEADDYKIAFHEKRKVDSEMNKIHNREREKV